MPVNDQWLQRSIEGLPNINKRGLITAARLAAWHSTKHGNQGTASAIVSHELSHACYEDARMPVVRMLRCSDACCEDALMPVVRMHQSMTSKCTLLVHQQL